MSDNPEFEFSKSTDLILDPDVKWDCHSCSDCCRGWSVPVSRDVRERLMSHDWGERYPHLAGGAGFMKPSDPAKPVFFSQVEGRCSFLDADNLCIQHKVLGYESKSLACSSFPFSFLKTPSGVVVTLSFACPSVIRNAGRPLALHRADLAAQAERGRLGWPSIGESITISGGKKISWEEYRAREARFASILSRSSLSLRERFADGLSEMLGVAIYRSADGRVMLNRLVLAVLVALGNFPRADIQRRAEVIFAIVSGRGRFRLEALGWDIDLSSLPPAPSPLPGEWSDMLTRYFSHWLFRKSLLYPFPDIRWGGRFMLASAFLAIWYASASAAASGRPAPTAEDCEIGLKVVDRLYVVHQYTFVEMIRSPFVRRLLAGVMTERRLLAMIPV